MKKKAYIVGCLALSVVGAKIAEAKSLPVSEAASDER